MSVLFVANCTKQDHDFVYITPETGKPRLVRIETGSQKQIHTSDNEMNLNAIVKQHEPYGLIPVNEVKRNRAFTGMCYSFDKPVPVDAIMVADEQNTAILEKFSDNVSLSCSAPSGNSIKLSFTIFVTITMSPMGFILNLSFC